MSVGTFLLGAVMVAIGGAGGSVLRWWLREVGMRRAARRSSDGDLRAKPWLTFLANALACFVLGIVVARLGSAASGVAELGFLLLAVGFCGGLSTLSTAALDVVELIRRGSFALSVAYFLLTIGTGMALLWVGLVIAS
ncbi:fluoride efflux transporter FluC [Brachybacterium sacelli]|uniref:Fluoride-specific ion channel FluC n=1 Tax=Brachybacterium sacelli TaxID=173364 RepID=A0ABS4X5M7_9MICO|nr:CrcB family protein [Brachybacterium sacelli]MBP2383019.1 CrcB protein [Brachybacterium sacelli]